MSIRTHYDNLHISPNATPEEIRQAYRRLSKQYHPDLNQNPDAHRIMQLINQAYEILSNPKTRIQHDQWIAIQNAKKQHLNTNQIIIPHTQQPQTTTQRPNPKKNSFKISLAISIATLFASCLLGWQIKQLIEQKQNNPTQPTPNSTHSSTTPNITSEPAVFATSSDYIRPYAAPNGNPWPQESGYLAGYPMIQGQNNHQLYVDNIHNSSDVYAELTQQGQTQPLRYFFIKERSYLILNKLDSGFYTIRYRQLDAGEELLSEPIQISGKTKEATIYLQRGKAPQ